MDKLDIRDLDNCYVCSEYMGPFKNELTVVTGYSEQPIASILGKLKESLDLLCAFLSIFVL